MNNNNSNSMENQRFILDILEEQKRRKRRRIDLIREEFNQSSQLEQELIKELESMAEHIPHQAPAPAPAPPPKPKPKCSKKPTSSNRKGKKPNLNRDHVAAHQKLIQDFFRFESINEHAQLQQQDHHFYSTFKLPKSLFNRIHADLTKNDVHFTQRKDALGNLGHSSQQKVLVGIRQLVHGIGKAEAILDSYIRMAESTALESLLRFCYNMQELYGAEYLREPTAAELQAISQHNRARGFPEGLHAYLGFTWWEWDHCPTGWSGRFKSSPLPAPTHHDKQGQHSAGAKQTTTTKPPPTIILEALVSHDAWFWATFVSTPGSCKDIDVFHPLPPIYSPAFRAPILRPSSSPDDEALPCYYLAAPLYPARPPLQLAPHHHLRQMLQNDFNRALNELQDRFKIIALPCRLWSSNSMSILIKTAIILHNMIIHHQRPTDIPSSLPPPPPPLPSPSPLPSTQDIQVCPAPLLLPPSDPTPPVSFDPHPPSDSPSIPPHVFAKLNHRYQSFNPTSSLLPQV